MVALTLPWPGHSTVKASHDTQLVSESSLLAGLAPGAVFPFIDSTLNHIGRAHIAVTDAAATAGAAPPEHIKVLVGQAVVALTNVMSQATNTGIHIRNGQCVLRVTVRPGFAGVPNPITDIVVSNAGSSALTGVNTITVSAQVRTWDDD
jgi:hypothetical protein